MRCLSLLDATIYRRAILLVTGYTLISPSWQGLPLRLAVILMILLTPWISLPLDSIAAIDFWARMDSQYVQWWDTSARGFFFATLWVCIAAPAALGTAAFLAGYISGEGRKRTRFLLWTGILVACCMLGSRLVREYRDRPEAWELDLARLKHEQELRAVRHEQATFGSE